MYSYLQNANGGYWGEHPDHPLEDWRTDVANNDTRKGYWEWVANMIEASNTDDLPD